MDLGSFVEKDSSWKDKSMHDPTRPLPFSSHAATVVLVSDFAKRFRLDGVEENRLRQLLGPIAKEIDLLRNAGK